MSFTEAIDKRYSKLAKQSCCLSCGGAIDYAKVRPGEVCLDLGSGRGSDVIRMAEEAGENGFAYGFDISEGMLEKARKTARKMDVENVSFVETELEKSPLEDHHLDLVISNCTINHASDKKAVWAEIYRTLKPGGRFVVSDIYSSEPVPPEYASDPEAVAECWAGAVTRDVYFTILEETGFKNISVFEESAPYPKGHIEVSSFTITGYK